MPGAYIIKELKKPGPNEIKSTYEVFDTRGGQDQMFGRDDQGRPNVLQRPNSGVDTGHFTNPPNKRPGFDPKGFTDPNVKPKPATGRARGSNESLSKATNKVASTRAVNTSAPTGGGKVKRIRAEGAKATRAKSVLSNNPSDDKLG